MSQAVDDVAVFGYKQELKRSLGLFDLLAYGLVFIVPGIVGPDLPAGFATFAAYGDFATGVLALLALLTARIRPLFWSFVVAFNLVGAIDIIVDYYHAIQVGLPAMPGQLGASYVIPIIYVPLLMITHTVGFYLLLRRHE